MADLSRAQRRVARRKQAEELVKRTTSARQQLAIVKRKLAKLGTERDAESADARRRREALRRRRMRLLFEIDRLEKLAQKSGPRSGKSVVQGPESGVTSVVQGGSPGLGKRS